MKHTYRVRIQRQRHYALIAHQLPALSQETLVQALGGAIVREISQGDHGNYFVDLQLRRDSHEQALNEILIAVQNVGYSWVEATVTEWADETASGALAGFVGGGIAGGSSGDGGAALLLGLFGALVGAAVGSFIERHKVVYTVHWTARGWVLQPQTQQAPTGLQPRLA
jgi:hypothetical protein